MARRNVACYAKERWHSCCARAEPRKITDLGRPYVVAIEADVLPAERGNVGEQFIGQRFAFGAKLGNGVLGLMALGCFLPH